MYSEGIWKEVDWDKKLASFSKIGHGQCIFTVSQREIRKQPEPQGDQDWNVWLTGTQTHTQEVESKLNTPSSSPGRNESGKPTFDDARSRDGLGDVQWAQSRQHASSTGLQSIRSQPGAACQGEQWGGGWGKRSGCFNTHGDLIRRTGIKSSSIHSSVCPATVQFAPSCKNKDHSCVVLLLDPCLLHSRPFGTNCRADLPLQWRFPAGDQLYTPSPEPHCQHPARDAGNQSLTPCPVLHKGGWLWVCYSSAATIIRVVYEGLQKGRLLWENERLDAHVSTQSSMSPCVLWAGYEEVCVWDALALPLPPCWAFPSSCNKAPSWPGTAQHAPGPGQKEVFRLRESDPWLSRKVKMCSLLVSGCEVGKALQHPAQWGVCPSPWLC